MNEPNLLITIDERTRDRAEPEVQELLRRAQVGSFDLTFTPAQGLIGVRIHGDPKQAVRRIKALLVQDPLAFHFSHRWVPIETWLDADEKALVDYARLCEERLARSSWRVDVQRHEGAEARDLFIQTVTGEIKNKRVDLEKPDRTIQFEVVGSRAGAAILGPMDSLSVDRTMKEEFVEFTEIRP